MSTATATMPNVREKLHRGSLPGDTSFNHHHMSTFDASAHDDSTDSLVELLEHDLPNSMAWSTAGTTTAPAPVSSSSKPHNSNHTESSKPHDVTSTSSSEDSEPQPAQIRRFSVSRVRESPEAEPALAGPTRSVLSMRASDEASSASEENTLQATVATKLARKANRNNHNLKLLTKASSSEESPTKVSPNENRFNYAGGTCSQPCSSRRGCSYRSDYANDDAICVNAIPVSLTGTVYGNHFAYSDINSLTWSGSNAAKFGLLSSICESPLHGGAPPQRSRMQLSSAPATAQILLQRQNSSSPYNTVRSIDRFATASSSTASSVTFQDDFNIHHRKLLCNTTNASGSSIAGLSRVNSNCILPSATNTGSYNWDESTDRFSNALNAQIAAKHLNTDQFMNKFGYKAKFAKYQGYMDRAFAMIQTGSEAIVMQGMEMMSKIMAKAWTDAKFGHDLAYELCDYVRSSGHLLYLLRKYTTEEEESLDMILTAGRALEECLSSPNRDLLVLQGYVEPIVKQVCKCGSDGEALRISISLFESLFKHSARTCAKIIELGGLDHTIRACKNSTDTRTLRHAALALSNLAMFSGPESLNQLLSRNVPEWLFLLASINDDITRYYACLAICTLVSNQEIEAAVVKSGTIGLVEPFLLSHKPQEFAASDCRHSSGRPKEWLEKLLPLLSSKRREARSMGAYHFVMETAIKKKQEKLEIFQSIPNLIEKLKELASSPDEVPANFASQALETIGETVPHKLSEDVPLWKPEDVRFWVSKIGFAEYADKFYSQQVDGDLLLLTSEEELKEDLGMTSSLLRRRFLRELKALKIGADYSCIDETRLDKFLMSISPDFSVYTYRMLEVGVDRLFFPQLTDEILLNDCRVRNGIHRMKILEAIEDIAHIEDMEVAVLRKHVDIFISYRRNTGSQLASLLRVLLQLRGYKVFIDVDRLYAGQFDCSLLMNIKAAKHFIIVLSPESLDRCIGDFQCNDWIHKEIKCALESEKNIIPVLAPCFEWPDENRLPADMRGVTRFNSVRWIHEYQEACVDKIDKFLKGEQNVVHARQQNSSANMVRASVSKFPLGSPSRAATPLCASPGVEQHKPEFIVGDVAEGSHHRHVE